VSLTVQYLPLIFTKATSIKQGPLKSQRRRSVMDILQKVKVDVADVILIER
jgi:hypothetical protein